MATSLMPLGSGEREVELEKADEENAENQVGETGKTVQAVEIIPEMPCFDMEAPCEGGSYLAHVDIICTGDEVRVFTMGHFREVEAKSGDKPSLENLKKAQGKDEELRLILNWLINSVTPGEGELFIVSPATKSYWLNKEQFCFNKWGVISERGSFRGQTTVNSCKTA